MTTPKGLTFVHKTEPHAHDAHFESCTALYIFAIDNDDVYFDLIDATGDERREYFGLKNDSDYPYAITPGATFTDYFVRVFDDFVIVEERTAIDC